MATQEDQNFVTKMRNEFVMSAENAMKEIQFKFADFHSQLDRGENNLIEYVEEIQKDILQKFDEITPNLKEIQQCRDSVVSILRKNSNKQLLETQLSSLTAEIDGIIGQSEIDKLIRLKWKYCELPINDVCTIATMNPKESVRHSPQADISQTLFPQYSCVSPSYAPDRAKDTIATEKRKSMKGTRISRKVKPISDKNTGVNYPNPACNQPPVAYPQHRDDTRFRHVHDYGVGYGNDMLLRNIAEMQRTCDLARHDDPPYHRPYDALYQPPALPHVPTTDWACHHCTMINSSGFRSCSMCTKPYGSLP